MSHHHGTQSLNALAFSATVHCLTGCAIGEVLGVVIGTALGWSDAATIALAIALAFFFGYSFTSWPLLRSGMALGAVIPIALASDTVSIAVMEFVDNAVLLLIPGAMEAGLGDIGFWASLAFALLLGAPAFAVDSGDIVVSSVKGEVRVTMNGAARDVRAASVLELPATVHTGRDGAIELKQGATSVSVGPDTQLEFPALEKRGAPVDRIVQPRGNAFYDIGKREGRKLRV